MTTTFFKLEKRPDASGRQVDTLVKCVGNPDSVLGAEEEEWCTVNDLDRLFEACARRWPIGWDLEKLITAVRECEFD